jgi:outer membrane protein OmpA-like peptidoglycan-associated protein
LGKRFSLNKNITENERALNRRVEIEIVAKPIPSLTVEVVIKGIVLNEKQQPIIAEISLSDKNGREIQSASSGKDGKYQMKAVINKKEDYSLTYYNDSSFIASTNINYSNQELPLKNLKTILPALKGGKKYILQNLNFAGDTSQLIAASFSSLTALYKLMKKNKTLVIRIEGHVNQPLYQSGINMEKAKSIRYVPAGMTNYQFGQWLSEERAKTVYNYLSGKGIEANRLSKIGYGANKMLVPNARTEAEMTQNRRVEISVISFK